MKMIESISLSILSGAVFSFEIIVYEFVTTKYPHMNTDILVWLYRLGSVFFITLFLIYMFMKRGGYKKTAMSTLESPKTTGWVILLSVLSAVSIISFFRSIDAAGSTGGAGIPTAVRSLYIPLTFVLSVMFIHKAKWGKYSWSTYLGMIGIAISICFIIYGTLNEK